MSLVTGNDLLLTSNQSADAGEAWEQPVDDTLSLADALAFDRGEVIADTLGLADSAATQSATSVPSPTRSRPRMRSRSPAG